jgi:hypothetical protein
LWRVGFLAETARSQRSSLCSTDSARKTKYEGIAGWLQKEQGCAVIVPDLRGHGQSNKDASDRVLDLGRAKKEDINAMTRDIEACKRFLLEQNNAGELNINLICVVAAKEMAIPAMAWTYADWQWPALGSIKQGQDVRGLVLLSPIKTFKGATLQPLLKEPLFSGKSNPSPLPVMIAVGNMDKTGYQEAVSLRASLEKLRPKVIPAGETDEEKFASELKQTTMFFTEVASEKFGADLVNVEQVATGIRGFIEAKVASLDTDFPWENRTPK